MVNYSGSQLDLVFHALADNTRRRMLIQLTHGDAKVSELAEPFKMSLPAISKHLRVLEQAGLIRKQKRGRLRYCSLQLEPFEEISGWMAFYQRFWDEKLDNLAKHLDAN